MTTHKFTKIFPQVAGSAQSLEHAFYAFFLLIQVGMNVEIQRRAYAGMSKQHAYRLVVALTFDAACGKAMTQAVEVQLGKSKLLHKTAVMISITARFGRVR